MKMKLIISILFLIFFSSIYSQNIEVFKTEPPNWWAHHTYNNIQLMIYGENLQSVKVEVNSDKITIQKVIHPSNSNYAFVNLLIDPDTPAGDYEFLLSNDYGCKSIIYSLLERDTSNNIHQGFSSEDVVYLIFPDRFVNGDESNDFLFNDNEEFEFGSLNGRHGGDLQGIIDKLDYLSDLGVTAIWSTPLTENNMYMSYHGYAATDLYKIDPRQGTNELYREFVKKSHQKGLKVILDHVTNHIGINHPWINNLPTETWLNGSPENHLPAEHNKTAYVDIHAGKNSIDKANLGWFVDTMPDLNQTDSLVAKYIIQNTLWWIEYAGIDGIREDTYPYANQKFMSDWAKEILTHYPKFNIVGEVWKGEPAILAAFQTNSYFPKDFDSNLPTITDFAISDALIEYVSGKSDLSAIYEVLGKDFVYSNPDNLLVFFDNHDKDRGMYAANSDIFKYKVALTIVLTSRGIPQLFYGSEIGLDGGGHHGRIRSEFPGGFKNNANNAFTQNGRNDLQNGIFNFTRSLLHFRKKYDGLRNGKLTQFPAVDNVYIYLRNIDEQSIIIMINDADQSKKINLNYYLPEFNTELTFTNLFNDEVLTANKNDLYELPQKSISIYLID